MNAMSIENDNPSDKSRPSPSARPHDRHAANENTTIVCTRELTLARDNAERCVKKTPGMREQNGLERRGARALCTNASIADVAIVLAVTDPSKGASGGIPAFAVDLTLPGVRRGTPAEKLGLKTSQTAELF